MNTLEQPPPGAGDLFMKKINPLINNALKNYRAHFQVLTHRLAQGSLKEPRSVTACFVGNATKGGTK